MTQWQAVIGLEIHTQLNTKSKIFSGSDTRYGAQPNTQACPLDLALPGTLPVINSEAVIKACQFGLAINAQIASQNVFARKNYFYPDLPKGYQISQLDEPIVGPGEISITLSNGDTKRIGITRAHLEEDAGKSIHGRIANSTAIDLNRAGTPLLEIVTEPDMFSAEEAVNCMRKIHALVTWIGICDGNLQEGSFRCDANVSIRNVKDTVLGTRAEIKNINSFRFVEKAINFEIARQIDLLENGGKVVQETRLYDSDAHETRSMRSKEEANDYRYFPDPDLLPIIIQQETLDQLKAQLPELPDVVCCRFCQNFGLSLMDAQLLSADRDTSNYFIALTKLIDTDAKLCANWVIGELSAALNAAQLSIGDSPVSPASLASLLSRIIDQSISGSIAKKVFAQMFTGKGSADEIIKVQGLMQISDVSVLQAKVSDVLEKFPQQVASYQSGEEKLLQFFVGQTMKLTQGKANPAQLVELLKQNLNK